ncbi:MAG TPA: DNA polymerase ligase N-terminal domain-containing protein [Rhizomicrobium sp.]|nr:DNA polymerase ligase N-terminal domain-containing protein [Rhizomicrobium sp.]
MARLSDYKAKRDFSRTAEPRGRVVKTKSQRFIIQRHDATRLHYDFRLELDGVYKSWAVTKVPSLDPATKRLAVEVEDHPLDYGTFEGTIPKGEYGGGTVQLWDRGTWKSQSSAAPLRDLENGQLKIELKGKRLKGGWALVRLRERDKRPSATRNNWLLIKEKDAQAKPGDPDSLLAEDTSVKSGRTLEDIAAHSRSVWHSNKAARISGVKKKPRSQHAAQ